ncbi:MAG TPA: hypothetical protein VD908_00845 [Cytophagales bacterium]|nr:hypothetical protein [Cytophagales bacterium]
MDNSTQNRDFKGDRIFKYDFTSSDIKWSMKTFVFHYYEAERDLFLPEFGLDSKSVEKIKKAELNLDYSILELYPIPEGINPGLLLRKFTVEKGYLLKYFKDVFTFLYEQSEPNFERVILSKKKKNEILNLLNDYQLLNLSDLIIKIIALAQYRYVSEIYFWRSSEMQLLINKAEKASEQAIDVIDKVTSTEWIRNHKLKKPKELERIEFVFEDTILKVEHSLLCRELVESLKESYNRKSLNDWRLQLSSFAYNFSQDSFKDNFRNWLAIGLYDLLVTEGFFIIKGSPMPHKLLNFIASILEFSLVKVGGKNAADSDKARNVKNYIQRNRKDAPKKFILAGTPFNKHDLLVYFEKDFIDLIDDENSKQSENIASYVAKRFNVKGLMPVLKLIAQGLFNVNSRYGYHFDMINNNYSNYNYKAFRELKEIINDKSKFSELKFKVGGKDEEFIFHQKLPLELIKESVKYYLKNFPEEFNTDVIKSNLTGSVNDPGIFNAPHERILVQIVKSFYKLLITEIPPSVNEITPSEYIYKIIASIFNLTRIFYSQNHPEWFLIDKVKALHKLSVK